MTGWRLWDWYVAAVIAVNLLMIAAGLVVIAVMLVGHYVFAWPS